MRHHHQHRHRGHDPRGDEGERRFARGSFGDHGHHHGRHRHGERHGRRSGGRLFEHGELRLVILALIGEQPRHGYELIKEIEERTAGTYSPSPGVIYPTLTMLEELGHAVVTGSEGKKLYAITTEGEAYLAGNRGAVDAALARMAEVHASHGGGPAPEIMRAARNLDLALSLRQGRGPLTQTQVREIAAALDAAATAVERS